ncbi:MAG: hypothetical protein AD742_20540 [Methylibium sp. NZG]|nr:MAG: hypothetical protein AD742_20540 [Methylibium sp. NZG]
MQSPPGAHAVIDGRPVLYFAGTAYFGLQGDPRVVDAACAAVRQQGLHAATSRTGFGETPLLLRVEQLAARFFGADDALYFAAGYAGVAVLMQCAEARFSHVLADESVHLASQDAMLEHGAPVQHFRHGDAQHLRELLRKLRRALPAAARVAVLCDGVSPVLGSVAPASDYIDAIAEHGEGTLIVDDAHGVGVLGRHGRGTLEHAADVSGRDIAVNASLGAPLAAGGGRAAWMCGTLSKALGGAGGIIAGSAAFVARMKAQARWYHGAAAPAAPVAGATAESLSILLAEPELRLRLLHNVVRLRQGLRGLGLAVADWPTPIVAVQVGDGDNMARIQAALLERGIAVAHSRNYPGVGADGALRIAVFSSHTDAMIDRLLQELAALL